MQGNIQNQEDRKLPQNLDSITQKTKQTGPKGLFKAFFQKAQKVVQDMEENKTNQVLTENIIAGGIEEEKIKSSEESPTTKNTEETKTIDTKSKYNKDAIPLDNYESILNTTIHSAPQLQALINYISQKITEFQSKAPTKQKETFPPFKVPNVGLVHITIEKTDKGLLVYLKLPEGFNHPQVYNELKKRLKDKYSITDIIEGEKLEEKD